MLNSKLEVIQSVIPAHSKTTAKAIVTNALAIIYEDQHLKLCTPQSVLLAVLAGARFGFCFCGDDAYLIPYDITKEDPETRMKVHLEWRCSFMAGYRGYIELAARNGYSMYAQDVWSGDKISIVGGTAHDIRHEMALGGRGELVGAYCLVRDAQQVVVNLSRIMFEEITHTWRHPFAQPWRKYVIASTESMEGRREAAAMGWRSFRIRRPDELLARDERQCPAAKEAGQGVQCKDCLACHGARTSSRVDLSVVIHGRAGIKERFVKLSIDGLRKSCLSRA